MLCLFIWSLDLEVIWSLNPPCHSSLEQRAQLNLSQFCSMFIPVMTNSKHSQLLFLKLEAGEVSFQAKTILCCSSSFQSKLFGLFIPTQGFEWTILSSWSKAQSWRVFIYYISLMDGDSARESSWLEKIFLHHCDILVRVEYEWMLKF